MTTDLKKNDEVKDEELECVAGGTGKDGIDEQPDGGTFTPPLPPPCDKYCGFGKV